MNRSTSFLRCTSEAKGTRFVPFVLSSRPILDRRQDVARLASHTKGYFFRKKKDKQYKSTITSRCILFCALLLDIPLQNALYVFQALSRTSQTCLALHGKARTPIDPLFYTRKEICFSIGCVTRRFVGASKGLSRKQVQSKRITKLHRQNTCTLKLEVLVRVKGRSTYLLCTRNKRYKTSTNYFQLHVYELSMFETKPSSCA